MGLSWSGRRRNNSLNYNPSPSQPLSSSSNYFFTEAPPRPPPPAYPPPSNCVFAGNPPYPSPPYPPLPQNHYYPSIPPPLPHPPVSSYFRYNTGGYADPMLIRSNYTPYYGNQGNGWPGIRPQMAPPQPPPPYIDHLQVKKIRNDVNVHKNTIRLEIDEMNPDCYLVSFSFDSLVDGSITIFYFAKEGANCKFTQLYPEAYTPVRVPFQKGLGQKFRQPSGMGIDLGFFELDDLSKPSPGEDVFPLIISAEAFSSSMLIHEDFGRPLPTKAPNAQFTQAVLEKSNGDPFQVKVIRQLLWVDEIRYELREIFGIGNSTETSFNNDTGKECVICLTEPKDTAVFPCRHLCMCSECAKALRLQSNKCPVCRQPIEELIEIKVNEGD